MIITTSHIKLYRKVGGDIDHLQRTGTVAEKTAYNENITAVIEELVSNLALVKEGLTSEAFAERIESKLYELSADEVVVAEIRKLIPI